MHRSWWNDLPVRWQLMISISVISVGAVLMSILLAVLDARSRVEVEVISSMELAQQLVNDVVKRSAVDGVTGLLEVMPEQLKYVRHARILVSDAHGDLVQIAPDESAERNIFVHPARAPQWFADLVGPRVGTREVRVMLGEQRSGSVVIVGIPTKPVSNRPESRRTELRIIWFPLLIVDTPRPFPPRLFEPERRIKCFRIFRSSSGRAVVACTRRQERNESSFSLCVKERRG
jgi:hypothetical protein